MSATIYLPSLSAVDVIVAAMERGQAVTLTAAQALEVYEALEAIREKRNQPPSQRNGQ